MSEVHDLTARIQVRRAGSGIGGEMVCECQQGHPEPAGWVVFIMPGLQSDFITGIACRACGGGYGVDQGVLDGGRQS